MTQKHNISEVEFSAQPNFISLVLISCRFGLAKFGSKINGIGFSEAACKISAQSDLIWLSYSFP